MKKYIYFLLGGMFFCQLLYSQSIQKLHENPASQLRLAIQLPGIGAPKLSLPTKVSQPEKPSLFSLRLAKNMDDAKLLCPFLKDFPTLELQGERYSNEVVGLKWETKNGIDNRSFEVERSIGDTNNFEKVNFVWASENGNGNGKYQLPDKNDKEPPSFYRLKLFLNDGTFMYSNMVRVAGYDIIAFKLYPNPATSTIKLGFSSKEKGAAGITFYDALGRSIMHQSYTIINGLETKEINVSAFPKGTYTVKIVMPDNQVKVGHFVKN